jgi:hypothetical protein
MAKPEPKENHIPAIMLSEINKNSRWNGENRRPLGIINCSE